MKPLGGKAYGSIPHLPMSRMGPADHSCHKGQSIICTEKARDKRDRIIVTEKLDGSNVSVANVAGQIMAIGRAGYLAQSSPHRMHHVFAEWVRCHEARFRSALEPGQRFVGEWLYQAHGTIYAPVGEPFIPFDVIEGKDRLPYDMACALFAAAELEPAHVISDGPPCSVEDALSALADGGFHGAREDVEGAVWRVERNGRFDFMAKFVRPDKVDGKYLPGCHGNPDGHGVILFPLIFDRMGRARGAGRVR